MGYVDGFVIAVPAANREAFLEHAHAADRMKAAMADARVKALPAMPFDGKRMIFGGFSTVVAVEAQRA